MEHVEVWVKELGAQRTTKLHHSEFYLFDILADQVEAPIVHYCSTPFSVTITQ